MNIAGVYRRRYRPFNHDGLVPLDHDAFCALPLVPAAAPKKLGLVYDRSVSSFFFEFEPGKDIDLFLSCCRIASLKRKDISLLSTVPLHDVLEERASDEIPTRSYRLRDLSPGDEADGVLDDPLQAAALDELKRSGNLKGMIGCCDCGEAGCASQYAWVKNYKCMALFSVASAALQAVELFPFSLDAT